MPISTHVVRYTLALACLTFVTVFNSQSAAQQQSDAVSEVTSRLSQFLETGEFSLAVAAANETESIEQRDQALASIAAKQQSVGANTAAIDTLAGITDDSVRGQFIGGGGGQRQGGGGGGFGQGGGRQGGGGLGVGGGGQGQQNQADFETLIDLVSTTIDPDTWEEVGGQGTIAGFPGGVFVDAKGLLRRTTTRAKRPVAGQTAVSARNHRATISLPRLEKALQLRRAAGLPPTDQMRNLGGLQRVDSIHVYPETGDVVISGPAVEGNDSFGLQLDDLSVVMAVIAHTNGKFGCSINPRQANLKRTQEFLAASSQRPLKPGQRPRWLAKIAESMGRQDIEVFGIAADTVTAQTLVQADYHMKLVGMGIEAAPAGLTCYLDAMQNRPGQSAPLDVLRWWFTSNYDSIAVNDDSTVYQLNGKSVKVLSENELLGELGQRVPTGQSSDVNQQFAADFTKHFEQLAEQHSFYSRLRGIMDLAVVAAVIFEDDLPSRVSWTPTVLIEDDGYLVRSITPATEVDSVIGHRIKNGTQIIAGVSGGVSLDAKSVVRQRRAASKDYALIESHRQSFPVAERGKDESWLW